MINTEESKTEQKKPLDAETESLLREMYTIHYPNIIEIILG